jgi:glycosyltransferase involved in cell wall biosynthesis
VVTGRRVTLVSAQLLGFDQAGGVGAATAFLAIALARMGHNVDIVYTQDRAVSDLTDDWARRYDEAGVRVRPLPPLELPVEPPQFQRMRAVELALRTDPPDVVIAHEYGAPAYIASRLKQLGLAYGDTVFVAYCHGTSRWVKEITRNERVSADLLANVRLESLGVGLADLVVSPSAYLIDWMRRQGWHVPDARVIPLVTRATALGKSPSTSDEQDTDGPVERVVFFGRLEKRKGVEPFVGGLNALPPELLEQIEVEFFGPPTKHWDPERVQGLLSERTSRALRGVSFETGLDQQEALARLRQPGTLAVIPSLAENSPNVVYECLEERIPFLASTGGGTGELVAAEDRARVLFEPTTEGMADALRRALGNGSALKPPRPAFEPPEVLRAWADVVATPADPKVRTAEQPAVDVIVHERGSEAALQRCLKAVADQSYEPVRVICSAAPSVQAAREQGLLASTADWVVFLDEDDVPEHGLIEVLVRAQAASGADVVTCALRCNDSEYFFVGDPGGLGLLANAYGTVALLKRALVVGVSPEWPVASDHDWPLLARLQADGAHIVSVPEPLVRRTAAPGTLEREPGDGLLVIEAFERALPDQLRLVARLAAGLAAEARRQPFAAPQGRLPRLRQRLRRFT